MKDIKIVLGSLSLLLFLGSGPCLDDLARMAPVNRLHVAASMNDLDGLDAALQSGIDINFSDESGNTALHFAASYGKVDAIKRLAELGANVNAKDRSGRTPLHIASPQAEGKIFYRKYADSMEPLLDHHADIDAQDSYGDTPLHRAVYWGILENVKFLLENGADKSIANLQRETPLAVAQNKVRPTRELLQTCQTQRDIKRSCDVEQQMLDKINQIVSMLQ